MTFFFLKTTKKGQMQELFVKFFLYRSKKLER